MARTASLSVLRRRPRDREGAGQAQIGFEEVADAAGIGLVRDDAEAGRGEEILRDRAPQVPERLDRRMLLALDERLGVEAQQLAQGAQELGGASTPIGACR
jgi:hypothetical protein